MSGPFEIGHLRRRIGLEQPQDAADDIGGVTRSYLATDCVWGAIIPVAGTDRYIAQRAEQTISHRILLRWRADVCGHWRLRCGARLFLVHAVFDPDERRCVLECRCEEIKI
jgi:SPP1 family predicted phage head-tail adaptor